MIHAIEEMRKWGLPVAAAAPLFDATEFVRGNGYRSLLSLCRIFIEKVVCVFLFFWCGFPIFLS